MDFQIAINLIIFFYIFISKSLIWNHYEGANVISYVILRGADKNTLSVIDSIPGSINIYSDLNPSAGKIIYQIKGVLSGDNNDTYIIF